MIYPLVPVFVAALGSGAILLGVIEGVAETTASMLNLVSGIVSDKIRKRKLLVLIGYSVSSLVRPLTGLVTSGWQIIIIRMLDRVGKGISSSPRDALIASSVGCDKYSIPAASMGILSCYQSGTFNSNGDSLGQDWKEDCN
jgi:MFS family permease